jgi:AcrR family transcriptional regulator
MSSAVVPRDTRGLILDAARSLFESQGYHGTGLAAVAERAGISRQAIYLHFSSKAELLRGLHLRIEEHDVEPAFRRVWAAESADDALAEFARASAKAIPKFLVIATTLNAVRHVDPDVSATWGEPQRSHYDDCVRLAVWLDAENRLVDGVTVADAADVLWNLAGIWSYESLVIDRAWSPDRWARWLADSLRRLLLRPYR